MPELVWSLHLDQHNYRIASETRSSTRAGHRGCCGIVTIRLVLESSFRCTGDITDLCSVGRSATTEASRLRSACVPRSEVRLSAPREMIVAVTAYPASDPTS